MTVMLFVQDELVSDAEVIQPGDKQQGEKLQVPSPPKPAPALGGPSPGELLPHSPPAPTGSSLCHGSSFTVRAFHPTPGSPAPSNCNLCGGPSSFVCPSCDSHSFCDACDDLFHRHPSRANHGRDKIQKTKQGWSHDIRTGIQLGKREHC